MKYKMLVLWDSLSQLLSSPPLTPQTSSKLPSFYQPALRATKKGPQNYGSSCNHQPSRMKQTQCTEIALAVSGASVKARSLTWGNIYLAHLGLRDVDVDADFALGEVDLHAAQIVGEVTENQEATGVPSPELEADRKQVLVQPPGHLQVAGGVEKHGHCGGFQAREAQVSLWNARAVFEENAEWSKQAGQTAGRAAGLQLSKRGSSCPRLSHAAARREVSRGTPWRESTWTVSLRGCGIWPSGRGRLEPTPSWHWRTGSPPWWADWGRAVHPCELGCGPRAFWRRPREAARRPR